MTFCKEVRKETDIYWRESFNHPFIQQLAKGTLPIENFKFYMMQDAYYLTHYAKVLALAASKSTTPEESTYYLENALFITHAELALHHSVFEELNVTKQELEQFEVAPTAYDYVSHMYNAIHNGDTAQAFAAMFPCPWLYYEIGVHIQDAKPGVKLYQDWIDLYTSPDYKDKIDKQIVMMNNYAQQADAEKRKILKSHFKKSCYYELKFWDMSITKQNWLPEGVTVK